MEIEALFDLRGCLDVNVFNLEAVPKRRLTGFRIVARFETCENVGAVVSNVTIWTRDSVVTRCQQLKYTIGVNICRQIFDHVGPG